jgi:hypothetical protein
MLAGIIAATAGPASAILMIPREQNWDAGGSNFFLRGSASDIWPNNLTFASNSSIILFLRKCNRLRRLPQRRLLIDLELLETTPWGDEPSGWRR